MAITEEEFIYNKIILCKDNIQANVLRIVLHKYYIKEAIDILIKLVTEEDELQRDIVKDTEIETALTELRKYKADRIVETFFNLALNHTVNWLKEKVDPVDQADSPNTSRTAYFVREVGNGVIDSLTGTWETWKGTCYALSRPKESKQRLMEGLKGIKEDPVKIPQALYQTLQTFGSTAKKTPIRLSASILTGLATGAVFSSAIGMAVRYTTGLNKTVKSAEFFKKTGISLNSQVIKMSESAIHRSLINKLPLKSSMLDVLATNTQSSSMLQQAREAAKTSAMLFEQADKLKSTVLQVDKVTFGVFECKNTAESMYCSNSTIQENEKREFKKREYRKKYYPAELSSILDSLVDVYTQKYQLRQSHLEEIRSTEFKESPNQSLLVTPVVTSVSVSNSDNQELFNQPPYESHALMFSGNSVSTTSETRVYSVVEPRWLVNYNNWIVSVMCKPRSNNPEHACLIIQGLDHLGKGFFLRYDMVDDRAKRGYAKIKEKSFNNIEPGQLSEKFLKDVIKDAAFCAKSWRITDVQGQFLIEDINQDKEKSIKYLISGSESIVAKLSSTNAHNCFTWARKKLHNLRDERIQLPEIWTDLFVAKTSYHLKGSIQVMKANGR